MAQNERRNDYANRRTARALAPLLRLGIRHTVYIDRGHGPSTDYYGYPTLQDLGGLPALVELE